MMFTSILCMMNLPEIHKTSTASERMNPTIKDQGIWKINNKVNILTLTIVFFVIYFSVLKTWPECDKVYLGIHNKIPAGARS